MSSKNCFQVPPGLSFGPDLPPLKLKVTKSKRKKVKSRAEAERARKSARKERRERRAARLQRRAARKEEEKQRRAESGEPQVTKIRIKRDLKSHHGTESVDITILKLLGKSHKSKKVAGKGKTNEVEKKYGRDTAGTGRCKVEARYEGRAKRGMAGGAEAEAAG